MGGYSQSITKCVSRLLEAKCKYTGHTDSSADEPKGQYKASNQFNNSAIYIM